MSNSFNNKYLVRGAWGVVAACLIACGGKREQGQEPVPQPTAPLPTAGIAGQRVALFPLTLVAAEDSLQWGPLLADRGAALARADSVIVSLITARAPEVTWVSPEELRRAARRSGGVAADPGQLGTAILRAERLTDVPDPLRSQLRTLVGLAGGRYAMIPAALVYRRRSAGGVGAQHAAPLHTPPTATAELAIVLVDARLGKVGWRTIARGDGADPWGALTMAVKALTPGLP
ncbi:MAG TPA: hypothetical protein VFX28_19740 [Methylomirabilota bacterium]|nr:hypothetical protein [Methylomirabilota bacterium]